MIMNDNKCGYKFPDLTTEHRTNNRISHLDAPKIPSSSSSSSPTNIHPETSSSLIIQSYPIQLDSSVEGYVMRWLTGGNFSSCCCCCRWYYNPPKYITQSIQSREESRLHIEMYVLAKVKCATYAIKWLRGSWRFYY